ncbi:glucokinase [Candidatus Venteria ishoeyi]|uniref:Glucokinase n=1 Tax=Candidatus Venteria ishoeyi TaxID=1899563 RepID=A0A1H6FD97_9GAMM|nr:glucokinase [Candidatus Venteria ishoeyi]SEH08052.1 Glucokinase [Candidatus Venteria ishoeyi]
MTMVSPKILVAEDNPSWQRILQRKLKQICYTLNYSAEITLAESYEHACQLLDTDSKWDLFITDLGFSNSPSSGGKALIDAASQYNIFTIIVTGAPTPHLAGMHNYFSKANFDSEGFADVVAKLLIRNTETQDSIKILAGDVGGTKVLLGIAEIRDGKPLVIVEERYPSKDFSSLLSIITQFLEDTGYADKQFESACFGIAGPVHGDDTIQTCQLTNLPDWEVINNQTLSSALHIPKVQLINDLQAIGYGIDVLDAEDLNTLQEGKPVSNGVRAIMAVGTGLGQAIMVWTGEAYTVLATEGGHVDFAPLDEQQFRLMQYVKKTLKLERVSCERLLSGDGLVMIYNFLCSEKPAAVSSEIQVEMQKKDPAAVISHFALKDKNILSSEALNLFIQICGTQAGNLALTCLPYGGFYIAGGVANKVYHELGTKIFSSNFYKKGRMKDLLINIPVRLIRNESINLQGAVSYCSKKYLS